MTRSPSPSRRLPRQCRLCCLGGVRLGLRPLLAPSQLQGPCWPLHSLAYSVWGDGPSPLQAWTQVAGTVPVDPSEGGAGSVLLQDFWRRDCTI